MKKNSLNFLEKNRLSKNLLKLINAGDGNVGSGLNTNNGGNGGCGVAPQIASFSSNTDNYKIAYNKWLTCITNT